MDTGLLNYTTLPYPFSAGEPPQQGESKSMNIVRTKWFLFGIGIALQLAQFADKANAQSTGTNPKPSGWIIIVTHPETVTQPPSKTSVARPMTTVVMDWLTRVLAAQHKE
jgi:hypothetical protein